MAAFAVFPPAVGALSLSLGIVGRAALPTRQGRNQACNGAGNVVFASIEAALGRFISLTATIFAVAGIGVLTAASMLGIRERDIHARAREAGEGRAASFGSLLRDRRIVTFACVVLLFNLANETCSRDSRRSHSRSFSWRCRRRVRARRCAFDDKSL